MRIFKKIVRFASDGHNPADAVKLQARLHPQFAVFAPSVDEDGRLFSVIAASVF